MSTKSVWLWHQGRVCQFGMEQKDEGFSWEQLYFLCVEALDLEHARALKLSIAVQRALDFGFVVTEKNGKLRNTRTDLQTALAAWENSK